MSVVTINVGHRGYGYKNISMINGVPEFALDIKKDKMDRYVKIATKTISGIGIALIALDLFSGAAFASQAQPALEAMARPAVDLAPIDAFSHEVWKLMLKGILYISIPVFSWVGYILALAGSNSGKRTAAKVVGLSMVSGIAFVAGAPWVSNSVYNFFTNLFHV